MADSEKPTTKRCTKCGDVKLLEAFYREKLGRFGRRSVCKTCWAVRAEAYRCENRDAIRLYSRVFYRQNIEMMTDRSNRYRKANRVAISEKSRQEYRKDPEKWRARSVEWRSRNREEARSRRLKYYRENKQKERARSAVSRAVRAGVLLRTPCVKCGAPVSTEGQQFIEAHHHRGYEEEFMLDVVWLCRFCHREVEREELAEEGSGL